MTRVSCIAAGAGMIATTVHVHGGVVSTGFEFTGNAFTVGEGVMTATFTGGSNVFEGVPGLYSDGIRAWKVSGSDGTGVIDFGAPATDVSFFAAIGPQSQGMISVLDSSGVELESAIVTSTDMSDAGAFFSFSGSDIGSIEVAPSAGFSGQEVYIDGFSATVTPAPGALGIMGLGGIAAMRRRRERRQTGAMLRIHGTG